MKKLPWNRFTKHLCVFVFLAITLAAYFWRRELLMLLVVAMILLVHRIERDYRSGCRQCMQCRRRKPPEEFDRTLCKACVKYNKEDEDRQRSLHCVRVARSPMLPGAPHIPKKPELRIPSVPTFAN